MNMINLKISHVYVYALVVYPFPALEQLNDELKFEDFGEAVQHAIQTSEMRSDLPQVIVDPSNTLLAVSLYGNIAFLNDGIVLSGGYLTVKDGNSWG